MNFFQRILSLFKKQNPTPQPTVIAATLSVPSVPSVATQPSVAAPAPVVSSAAPPIYPATHNFGDYRDVQEGESPEAYFKRTGLGGYGKTTAQLEAENEARQPQQIKDDSNAHYNGPVAISSLTDDDKRFLLYAQENYSLPQGLFFAVLNGKKFEIDAVIGWADAHRWGAGSPEVAAYNGPMKGYVDSFAKGQLKQVVA